MCIGIEPSWTGVNALIGRGIDTGDIIVAFAKLAEDSSVADEAISCAWRAVDYC